MGLSIVSVAIGVSGYVASIWLAASVADKYGCAVSGVRGAASAAAAVTFALIVSNVAKAILSP